MIVGSHAYASEFGVSDFKLSRFVYALFKILAKVLIVRTFVLVG